MIESANPLEYNVVKFMIFETQTHKITSFFINQIESHTLSKNA